jgi:hypothetical protein
MENGKKPAFNYSVALSDSEMKAMSGLTKREYFAGLAMQGILSNESFYERMSNEGGENKMVDKVSIASVKMADALLEALSKP